MVVGVKCRGIAAAVTVVVEVSKFVSEPALALSTVGRRVAADGRLEQFPNFPGRQLSQDCFAFTQAQPLQEPDLLHLQHAIFSSYATDRLPHARRICEGSGHQTSERSERTAVNSPSISSDLRRVIASCLDMRKSHPATWLEERRVLDMRKILGTCIASVSFLTTSLIGRIYYHAEGLHFSAFLVFDALVRTLRQEK